MSKTLTERSRKIALLRVTLILFHLGRLPDVPTKTVNIINHINLFVNFFTNVLLY